MVHLVFILLLAAAFAAATPQHETQIVEYYGKKYLKFSNPCHPNDEYCPLDCSQQHHASANSTSVVCVQCICKDGQNGISNINPTTLPPTMPTPAHYNVVIQDGRMYLRLHDACAHSDSLCSIDCDVKRVLAETGEPCSHCNCSYVTTPEPAVTSTVVEVTGFPTTTGSKEVVLINGIAHLLVDFPCTPRDNVCPVNGCIVDGVVEGVTGLCFRCECTQPATPEMDKSTTTLATTPSTARLATEVSSSDTLMVGGILKIVVSNPCSTDDNLCSVHGCSVEIQTTHIGICFKCLCTIETSRTTEQMTTQPTGTTSGGAALKTVIIAGVEYTMLQNPCSPRDGLCPIKSCTIEGRVSSRRSICFSCEC